MELEDAVTLLGKMHAIFRRKYRTIALLVIVAVLFYLLQCFTVSKLGQLSNQRNRRWSEEDLIRDLANQVNSDLHYKHEDDDQHFFRGRNRVVDAESKFQVEAGDAHFGNDEEELKKELVDKMNVRKDKLHIENNKENKILGGIHVNMQNNDKTKHDNLGGMNAIMQIEDRLRNTNLGGMSVDKKNEKLTSCAGELQQTKQVSSDTSEVLAAAHAKLLGVLASEKHLYKADESNMFTCLHAPQVRIPYQQVNDDFCDCPDSSDEPGTSACPNSKFYCTRQLPGTPPQFITSSKVNDGICDCCDGSDEWLGNLVPDFMRIRDGEKLGAVYHAPCSDKCDHILALHHHEEVVRTKGREMQKDYLRQAQELTEDERKRYGPNGVFYALSKHCYKINVHQYEYEVCPFSKVSQQAFPHTPVILGRSSTVTLDKGEHLLIMDGGDNALCPFGRARKSKIYLLCGLEDKLIRVTETEVCEYTFGMSSPAAC